MTVPTRSLTHTHAIISAPCCPRVSSALFFFTLQTDFDHPPVSPFFYISIVRYTYWSLLLHCLPPLQSLPIMRGFLFVNIPSFFWSDPLFFSSFLPLQLLTTTYFLTQVIVLIMYSSKEP